MMLNSERTAVLLFVLGSPRSLEILSALLEGPKRFSYFNEKYGIHAQRPLKLLIKHDLITKIHGEMTQPVGYKITGYGIRAIESSIKFSKELEMLK